MHIQRGLDDIAGFRGGIVSIGNFDGVHRGHQAMIAALVGRARRAGVPAIVLTFDPHPIRILRPAHAPPLLSTLEQRLDLIAASGADVTLIYTPDQQFLNLTPEEFFSQVIQGDLQARGLVEGPSFSYGRGRSGDVASLRKQCAAAGLSLEIVRPVMVGDRLVSSSEIRRLLLAGEVAPAADLLGRLYSVRGNVVIGAARGRAIGFPTANLDDVATLLPRDGVYAGLAEVDGRRYTAAINLGPNPTFHDERRKFEVHLLDFSGDLYGRPLEVAFLRRVRDTIRFGGINELVTQLQLDIARCRELADGFHAS